MSTAKGMWLPILVHLKDYLTANTGIQVEAGSADITVIPDVKPALLVFRDNEPELDIQKLRGKVRLTVECWEESSSQDTLDGYIKLAALEDQVLGLLEDWLIQLANDLKIRADYRIVGMSSDSEMHRPTVGGYIRLEIIWNK